MNGTIITGDCREILPTLPAGSVHCCVTSPPYWGLRDYGVAGQIGLELTPDEYVGKLVAIFREVRRVLRDDGTLWLNLGDCYANDGKLGGETGGKQAYHDDANRKRIGREKRVTGLKPKDLIGIPWRVAFALQDDGWWLRQEIIWHKPNGLPESVADRCTKNHEHIFLLAKSELYYFDFKAIEEPCTSGPSDRKKMRESRDRIGGKHKQLVDPLVAASSATNICRKRSVGNGENRRKRSVWSVASGSRVGHLAAFPARLIRPCVLAGCPQGGVVLDPFLGSGTTAVVAAACGCNYVGIELNPKYVQLAKQRNAQRRIVGT